MVIIRRDKSMNKLLASLIILIPLILAGCEKEATTTVEAGSTAAESKPQSTAVTEENYALAECQIIFADYVKRIAVATNTNGSMTRCSRNPNI